VGSVVVSGHSDRLEASEGDNSLSENRAKAAMEYLVSKGVNPKLVFWEGVGSRQPVPVTKFCE
ncbi:MAG TPA: OmpA family protein, partial [Steroidobacteraceae bacterium]|nr:OmpA family protein [Steroidobacteraceae bacterium]